MTNSDRKNGTNTDERSPDGTFADGNPGKPVGARHKVTRAFEKLLDGEAEALGRKAIDLALEGDTVALRLCLERVLPSRKDTPIKFDLPAMINASEAAVAAQAILRAVSEGEVTPLEGATVMGLVEHYRRVLETTDLEERISKLEAKK